MINNPNLYNNQVKVFACQKFIQLTPIIEHNGIFETAQNPEGTMIIHVSGLCPRTATIMQCSIPGPDHGTRRDPRGTIGRSRGAPPGTCDGRNE